MAAVRRGPAGCRGRRMRGSSAGMRRCWRWTGPSTPSRSCCCTRSPGRASPSTAAEFARWYQATGGLDQPGHPEWPGAVLWSSFEHHLTADRVIGTAGDYFAALLEANGIAVGGGHRPRPAPRHCAAGAGAGAGAVGVGQRRAGHRVPGRHPQRLDPGRARRPGRTCCGTWPSTPGARCWSPPAATSTPGSATCPPGSSCRRCRCGKACSWPPRWPPGTATAWPGRTGGRCCGMRPGTR